MNSLNKAKMVTTELKPLKKPPHLRQPHSIGPEPHKRSLYLLLNIYEAPQKAHKEGNKYNGLFVRFKLPQYYTKWRQIWV